MQKPIRITIRAGMAILLISLIVFAGCFSHSHDRTSGTGKPDTSVIHCELAVVGGGSGGFGAALAAARLGVDVVLIEQADCLGGNSVRSGVNCWEMGAGATGIPFDIYKRLKKQKNAIGIYSFGRHQSWFNPAKEQCRYPGGETVIDPARRYLDTLQRHRPRNVAGGETFSRTYWHGVQFEPDAMAQAMLSMLKETGHCRVLLNTSFESAVTRGNRIESVRLSDERKLVAAYYVDSTGDGLVCTSAGCRAMMGQESQDMFSEPHAPTGASRRVNGVTLIYRVTPVSVPGIEPLPAGIAEKCWWAGRFPASQNNHYPNGDLNINMLPTMDGAEFLNRGYQDAMDECRKRVRAHWHDLQSNFPEFFGFRISWIAPALGIRESRRIIGEYVLTEHDLQAGISGQKHADIIALADHAMDTHGSHARGIGDLAEPYGVPYRCLIPKGKRNLLVACRAASFSSLAASSCRLSRTMMQLGQAAGTAVALAKELRVDLPDIPDERLRASLRRQNVQLEHPMPDSLRRYLAVE